MQTKFIFILLQLYCLLFSTNGHLSYKYKIRSRSRGSLHNSHTAQALVLESTSSSSNSQPLATANNNNHQSQIECDFLNHKETGCEDEIGSRCDANTSKCVCKDSHPVRLLDFCLKISRLNGPCYTSGQCAVVANASCYIFGKEYDLETSSGGHNLGRLVKNWPLGICKCRLGFAYNLTTNACEKRIIGSWCSHDKHCLLRSLNSICDKKRGECECAWGTRYESNKDTCVPDTAPTNAVLGSIGGVGGHLNNYGSNRPVYYMSKCEQDSDCSSSSSPSSSSSSQQTQLSSASSSGISSTNSPSLSASTVTSTVSSPSSQPPFITQSSTSSSASAKSSNHHPPSLTAQLENNNLMLEQADQENQFNQIRYLHGHRRLKDNSKRLTNYHLRELQCIRGRCVCSSLHLWDGSLHCKEPYDTQSPHNSSTHRHNRKNHNTFGDLDDELNDEFDDENSVSWQTICLMGLGSSLFAGFIFRYCYYRKGEDDDELSEGLRSPDGLYAHKAALGREHPFNPVTVAFLSKPAANGATCGNHFGGAGYGFITSAAPGCYHHEFDYGYDAYGMCAAPPHPPIQGGQMRGHMPNSSLGKPPNEEDEDAYLEQNPEERENYEKKEDSLEQGKYGCVQCGQIRSNLPANINHSASEIQPTNQCCGYNCTNLNNLNSLTADGKASIDTTQLTRAILEQYGNESVAGDSLNSTVGLRDVIDCVTPATTATTTCGRTSSGNTTNNEEDDDEHNKSSANESTNLENELKEDHLSSLLTQATNNLHTSFMKKGDLGSEEDSNEETSDEHIAILNCKTRKDQIKKWRSSSSSAESTTIANSNNTIGTDPSSLLLSTGSPSKNNKSSVPLLIESQAEQFQIA